MNNHEAAECLLSERCNATEIAEALEITRQSALAIIRTIDRKRLRRSIFAASGAYRSMAAGSRILEGNTGNGG